MTIELDRIRKHVKAREIQCDCHFVPNETEGTTKELSVWQRRNNFLFLSKYILRQKSVRYSNTELTRGSFQPQRSPVPLYPRSWNPVKPVFQLSTLPTLQEDSPSFPRFQLTLLVIAPFCSVPWSRHKHCTDPSNLKSFHLRISFLNTGNQSYKVRYPRGPNHLSMTSWDVIHIVSKRTSNVKCREKGRFNDGSGWQGEGEMGAAA